MFPSVTCLRPQSIEEQKIQDGPKMEHGQEGVSFSLSPNRGSKASTLHVHVAQQPLCPGIFPCDTTKLE